MVLKATPHHRPWVKKLELIKSLQQEAAGLFFEHRMHEINESLTTILALTDIGSKDPLPKIRDHVESINVSLKSVKQYQKGANENTVFEVGTLLKNIQEVLRPHIPRQDLGWFNVADIRIKVDAPLKPLQDLLVALMVVMCPSEEGASVCLEARQKGVDYYIQVSSEESGMADEVRGYINELAQKAALKPLWEKQEGLLTVTLRLPIRFAVAGKKSDIRPTQKVTAWRYA